MNNKSQTGKAINELTKAAVVAGVAIAATKILSNKKTQGKIKHMISNTKDAISDSIDKTSTKLDKVKKEIQEDVEEITQEMEESNGSARVT